MASESVSLSTISLDKSATTSSVSRDSSCGGDSHGNMKGYGYSGWVTALVLFFFLWLFLFIIFLVWKPKWLHKKGKKGKRDRDDDKRCDDDCDDDCLDFAQAALWAFFAAIVLLIFAFLLIGIVGSLWRSCRRRKSHYGAY